MQGTRMFKSRSSVGGLTQLPRYNLKFMKDVQSTRPTGRPGHHEGEHRTKQGSTVDEESKSSQEARQSIVRIQLQKVQKFRGLFRSHDEPSMFSAGCCSSSCGAFPKVRCTPPCRSDLFTNTSVQPRRGRMMTSWTQTHLSSPRSCQGPRCQGDRGSNVPCIAGGCVLTISDDDHGEIQRQHLSSFCTYYCYFILLVLASNQSCLTRLTIRSKD